MYILRQQPQRNFALGLGASNKEIVLVRCDEHGTVFHTPFLGIDWLNSADDGWQVRDSSA